MFGDVERRQENDNAELSDAKYGKKHGFQGFRFHC